MTLADHTGTVRLVQDGDGVPLTGSAIEAEGQVAPAPDAPGGVQLIVERLTVVGPAGARSPLAEDSSLEERMDWRWLDLRDPRRRLAFTVQTTLENAMRAVWAEHGFIEIHSPKLLATGPRPDELFNLGYFDRRAWLAQSPQFYKQMAMAAGFDRVFEVGPVFRAEQAVTSRHATEFTSLDVEMAWIDSAEDVMDFGEEWLTRAIADVVTRHGEEMAAVLGMRPAVPRPPFPRITLAEAWDIAVKAGHPGGDGDLDPDAERLLSLAVEADHGHQLVWVTDYPDDLRPFYHMLSEEGSRLTRSFDLLWGGMEVASGAQREHRHARLLEQAAARNLPLDPIRHYLEFFRFGCPPHGGFGFGLNRLLARLLGQTDIRETTLLPRDRVRLSP
jgi:aspartyl-tRNA synthetase